MTMKTMLTMAGVLACGCCLADTAGQAPGAAKQAADWEPAGWGGGGWYWSAVFHPTQDGVIYIGQDTGGAIRGPARGDIFFGFGPEAELRAGGLKAPGMLYVLVPNNVAQTIGSGKASLP